MATCPKCKADIYEKARICPNCKTIITSNKKSNNKSKAIPLKVKKSKSPRNNNEINNFKTFSTVKIVFVTLLLIINIYLIIDIVINLERKETRISEVANSLNRIPSSTTILGSWQTQKNGLYVFQDNYKFYWYDNYKVLNNNYYGGDYNYKTGQDALDEMGYTEEEFKVQFGDNIKLDNVYSINIIPKIVYRNNKDISTQELSENEKWWFIVIVKDDHTAFAYNQTLDLRYNLTKE